MGFQTNIEWCDHTWNPWRGCGEVSPGCDHCYARVLAARNPAVLGEWGPEGNRPQGASSYLQLPFRWNDAARHAGEVRTVFCLSLGDCWELRSDLIAPRLNLLRTIGSTPWLKYLLLTKRPQNWREALAQSLDHAIAQRLESRPELAWAFGWYDGVDPPNVMPGASVESQRYADERVPELLRIPGEHFLSLEPLLDAVDLSTWLDSPDLPGGRYEFGPGRPVYRMVETDEFTVTQSPVKPAWVIVGGESGADARPFQLDWARSLRDQCRETSVAFFMKQAGRRPEPAEWWDESTTPHTRRVIRARKGDLLDELPEDLRIRDEPSGLRRPPVIVGAAS